jgi:hypothetical protein
MTPDNIIASLKNNREAFRHLLEKATDDEIYWSQEPGKWCLLEIVCHLHDEEIEDFRTRVKCVLEDPYQPPPPIDPVGWVKERKYRDRNFEEILFKFLKERDLSIKWLESLKDPAWGNTYVHPKLGPMSAILFLTNWLAHDVLHFRQIIRLKYEYLKEMSGISLDYAGRW